MKEMKIKNESRIMTSITVSDKSLEELDCLFSCKVDDDDFYMTIGYNLALTAPTHLQSHIQNYQGSRLRGALFGLGFAEARGDEIATLLRSYLNSDEEFAVSE